MPLTFFWHDYETFGVDPKRDCPAQFAGLRTTVDFDPVDEPLVMYCKPSVDLIPHPEACLITGITPQYALRKGVPEYDFFSRIHEQMSLPETCSLGYNSIRFDDEVTRHGLWRNFFEPYGREWRHGCSRWDLIDVARMCYALRPEGVQWPVGENNLPSFRLEHLSAANNITHENAHDALADVYATLALARLLKWAQPKIFEFLFTLRDKRKAAALLDCVRHTPVLHASSRFSAERGCLAMVMPIAPHPTQTNAVIVLDLDSDPEPLAALSIDDIRDRVFVSREDLPPDIARVPLKVVHLNKSPALAPLSVLKESNTSRIKLDVERCLRHLAQLQAMPDLTQKVREVFSNQANYVAVCAEQSLYSGLPSDADLAIAGKVRNASAQELQSFSQHFKDSRYRELLFRYRARHFPDTLTEAEQHAWRNWRQKIMVDDPSAPENNLGHILERIRQLRYSNRDESKAPQILDEVESWVRSNSADLNL